MQIKVIQKKASSLKELEHTIIEIKDVVTLKDLLINILIHQFQQLHLSNDPVLSLQHIDHQALLGKVSFGLYQQDENDIDQAIQVMIQDFQDGLFRVFLNGEECLHLDDQLHFLEDNEVVLIRLVMLAGRLW